MSHLGPTAHPQTSTTNPSSQTQHPARKRGQTSHPQICLPQPRWESRPRTIPRGNGRAVAGTSRTIGAPPDPSSSRASGGAFSLVPAPPQTWPPFPGTAAKRPRLPARRSQSGEGAVEGLYGNLHGLGRKPSRAWIHWNPASRRPWLPAASRRETLGSAQPCRRAPCFADSGAEPPSTSGLRPHDLPEGLVHGDAHGSGEVERPQAFPELGNPHTTLRPNGRVYLRRTAAALVPKE